MSLSGISTGNIDSLCLEVQDYAERMQNILNQIDNVFSRSKSSFQGDVAPEFYAKYEILQLSYKTINHNILSYIDDFRTLAARHIDQDNDLAQVVEKSKIEMLEERGNEKWQ